LHGHIATTAIDIPSGENPYLGKKRGKSLLDDHNTTNSAHSQKWGTKTYSDGKLLKKIR